MGFTGKLSDQASRDQSMHALGHQFFNIAAEQQRMKAFSNPPMRGLDRPPGCWTPPPPPRCLVDTARSTSSMSGPRHPGPGPASPLCASARGGPPRRKLLYSTIGADHRVRPECIKPFYDGISQLEFRRRWSINEIENMLRFKVASKSLSSSNLLSAYRMFFNDKRTDLSPEDFRGSLSRLCGDELTMEEVLPIFHKYDADGGGTLDADEFVNGVLIGVTDKAENKAMQFTLPRYAGSGEPSARQPRIFRGYGLVGGTAGAVGRRDQSELRR